MLSQSFAHSSRSFSATNFAKRLRSAPTPHTSSGPSLDGPTLKPARLASSNNFFLCHVLLLNSLFADFILWLMPSNRTNKPWIFSIFKKIYGRMFIEVMPRKWFLNWNHHQTIWRSVFVSPHFNLL